MVDHQEILLAATQYFEAQTADWIATFGNKEMSEAMYLFNVSKRRQSLKDIFDAGYNVSFMVTTGLHSLKGAKVGNEVDLIVDPVVPKDVKLALVEVVPGERGSFSPRYNCDIGIGFKCALFLTGGGCDDY